MVSRWARALVVACATLVIAGPASAKVWHVGARGGAGMTTVRGGIAGIFEPSWQFSPTLGGFMEADLGPTVSVAIEAAYVQKGTTFETYDIDESGSVVGTHHTHLVLEYAEVPILMRVFLPGAAARPYVVAGPTLGFALKGTVKPHGGPQSDETSDMKPVDIGATLGVGARFATAAGTVDIEARYGTGFSDLWDVSNNRDSINQGCWLTLGLSR